MDIDAERETNKYDSLNAPWTASGQQTRLSLLQRMNAEQIDELTWQEFFRKYSPFVIMMGKSMELTRDEIKELWSTVFLEIDKKGIGAYDREKGSFRSWFKRIVKNRALDILRKRNTAKEIPTEDIYDDRDKEAASSSDDECEKVWCKILLYSLIMEMKDVLNPIDFQVFYMITLQGRKLQEVASVCNLKENTVSQKISRLTQKLHNRYRELQKEYPLESMSPEILLKKEAELLKEYHAIEKEYADLLK